MATYVVTGRTFGQAVCKHLGIDCASTMNVRLVDDADEVFGVEVTIALTANDLQEIAKIMDMPRETSNT